MDHHQTDPTYVNNIKAKITTSSNNSSNSSSGSVNSDNMTVIRLMQDLSEALNGRGKTVDKLQVRLQELLIKLQVEEQELLNKKM